MILITGASGFIGSHLAEELAKSGCDVRVLIRKHSVEKFKKAISPEILEKIEIAEGDLLDRQSLLNALNGIKKVFHLAAIARPMNVPNRAYYEINLHCTKNLLEACKQCKVRRFIHISTMSVFGYSRTHTPLKETSPKLPVSHYGRSKLFAEEFALKFCKKNKINLVIVRPPMVFGPMDFQFLKLFRLINTGFFPLLRGGKAKFEFCYVKNIVSGILLADKFGRNLEAYNINDGKTYTIKEAFSEIAKAENKKLFPVAPPVFLVMLAGKFMEFLAKLQNRHPLFNSGTAQWMTNDNTMDISKAQNEIHYRQIIPLQESIKETVEWYKKRGLL